MFVFPIIPLTSHYDSSRRNKPPKLSLNFYCLLKALNKPEFIPLSLSVSASTFRGFYTNCKNESWRWVIMMIWLRGESLIHPMWFFSIHKQKSRSFQIRSINFFEIIALFCCYNASCIYVGAFIIWESTNFMECQKYVWKICIKIYRANFLKTYFKFRILFC